MKYSKTFEKLVKNMAKTQRFYSNICKQTKKKEYTKT